MTADFVSILLPRATKSKLVAALQTNVVKSRRRIAILGVQYKVAKYNT